MVLETHPEKALVTLDPTQAEAVTSTSGPVVVLGEPGTGKTTVVVERAAHLIASGVPKDRVLVLGLSHRSMAELTSRLAGRLGTEAPPVITLHSLALGLVRRHYREAGYRRPPRSLSGQDAWRHLKSALEREKPSDWPRYGHMLRSQTLLAIANDLVAGSAHNALDDREILDRIAEYGRNDLSELVRFLGRYLRQLKEQGLVDLQWSLVEALNLLENHPEIRVAHRDRYPHLLVDEFEDASFTQARLARLLGGNGLSVAGNPEQAINSFQGGSPAYLRELATSSEVRVLRLTTCYRSAVGIQRACRSLVEAGGEPAEDGDSPNSVTLHSFAHQGEEPHWIAQEILSLLRSGIGPQQIAVLFRSGKDPVARELSRRLIQMGIPVRALADSQSVAADPLVGAALEVLRYLASPAENRKALFARLLTSPLAGMTPAELRGLSRTVRERGTSLLEAASTPSVLEALPSQVADAVACLASRLASLEPYVDKSPTGLLWKIWVTFPVYAVQAVAWSEQRLDEIVGSPATYRAFLEEVGRIVQDTPSTTIGDLLALHDAGYFRETVSPAGQHPGAGITLTTIHQARGRGWEYVFLPNLVEGVYPLRRSPVGTLAPLLMRKAEGEPEGARERHLAEERRLLLVGLSRACKRVYLTHSAAAPDGTTRLAPSRYLSLLRPAGATDGEDRRKGVEELLVHYRRQLSAEHPAARAQALYALGRLAEAFPAKADPSLWWDTRDETAEAAAPYPSGSLRLSASQLTSYRNCPLQFQFARHLSLEEVASDATTLGTLVHDVLEAYHGPQADLPAAGRASGEAIPVGGARHRGAPPNRRGGGSLHRTHSLRRGLGTGAPRLG